MGTRLFFLRLNIDLFSLPLQDIDGQALLLLTLPTVQECMDLKLGPAIKLCHQIERVKVAFYRQYANWSRSSASPTEHPGREAWEMLDVGLGASWWKMLEVLAMESVQRDLFFLFSFFFGFVLESCFGKTQKKTRTCGLISGMLLVWKCDATLTRKEKKKKKTSPAVDSGRTKHIGVDPSALLNCEEVILRGWGLVSEDVCVFISCFSLPFYLW